MSGTLTAVGLGEMMIALLETGHEPNGKDTYGHTPLAWAVRNGHEAVVKYRRQPQGMSSHSRCLTTGDTPPRASVSEHHKDLIVGGLWLQ